MVERKPLGKVQKQKPAGYVEAAANVPPEGEVQARRRRPRRVVREQLSTRIRVSLRDLMDEYQDETGMGPQAQIEEALTEYLSARGHKEQG